LGYTFLRYVQSSVRPKGERLMQGVVTLLDDQHYARVQAIWEDLCQKFDVRGMYVTSFPHFSYQVAEKYDDGECERSLKQLAARSRPFRIRTAGLGIFTVANPILYVPIVRAPALSKLHQELWDEVRQSTPGAVSHYYQPESWVPHITLAQGDIDQDKLAEIVRRLSARNFHWELTVNNITMIYDTGREQGLSCRFNFGG
jgi:2'-5' RNA ligase